VFECECFCVSVCECECVCLTLCDMETSAVEKPAPVLLLHKQHISALR
jgi:hypothetical protein